MATYSASSLGIKSPAGGFQQGGWYSGRQYWNGTLSDPGVIHPQSNQQGAGSAVSQEVNAQSAASMGMTSAQIEAYLQSERQKQQASAVKPVQASSSGIGGGAGTGAGVGSIPGLTAPSASINLPDLYQSLYNDSGINSLREKLSTMEKSKNDAISKINDNPYYSEATRTGRLRTLEDQFSRDSQSLKNDIATKAADIETAINLKTKQFDIDSQQAKDAMTQFNTLLGLGALDNASGDEIAAITRTTGLSSSMISSAINAKKQKDVQTSTIQFDDGTNTGFAIINSQTGEIISKQVIGSSKPTKDGTGTGGLTPAQQRSVISSARALVVAQDTNKDKMLSQQEYTNTVQELMVKHGIDFSTADDYIGSAFSDLGYRKWKW